MGETQAGDEPGPNHDLWETAGRQASYCCLSGSGGVNIGTIILLMDEILHHLKSLKS